MAIAEQQVIDEALSEVAFALKRGKRVVSLGSWEPDPAVLRAETPEQAVEQVLAD